MEQANFKKIQRLLEISERERHHEIFLTAKNLRELSRSSSPYIIPVIPLPLPAKIVEREHYVIADLLNLVSGGSTPTKNSETEAIGRELVISAQSGEPSLAREDSGLVPQASKRTVGVAVSSVFLSQKRVLVLPPKHLIREGGCPKV